MAEEAKPIHKNRIVINLTACAVEVESSTASLDVVHTIADELMGKVSGGISGDKTIEKRLNDVGIN